MLLTAGSISLSEAYVTTHFIIVFLYRPGQRTVDDLEIIYDELLHIKALSHLSTTVSVSYSSCGAWAYIQANAVHTKKNKL